MASLMITVTTATASISRRTVNRNAEESHGRGLKRGVNSAYRPTCHNTWSLGTPDARSPGREGLAIEGHRLLIRAKHRRERRPSRMRSTASWKQSPQNENASGSDPFLSAHAAIPVVVVSACLSRWFQRPAL